MLDRFRVVFAFAALLAFAPSQASAIEVAVAKKCNDLLAKKFPPAVAGNPAAGSKAGDAKAQRAYFNTCVANNGKMDEPQQPQQQDTKK